MDLSAVTSAEVVDWGRSMLNEGRGKWSSFEEASQSISQSVYDNFHDRNGERTFALVRVFRLANIDELPPEGLENIDASENQWLTLCGTVGDEVAWCNRLQSNGHRIIPAGAFETPMLKATFQQLGFSETDSQDEFIRTSSFMSNFFHVEEAKGSQYIVAQDEFVIPYNIKSVVGIGSVFASNSFYMCLCFSKISINPEEVENFAQLSPYISTLLASYDKVDSLWS